MIKVLGIICTKHILYKRQLLATTTTQPSCYYTLVLKSKESVPMEIRIKRVCLIQFDIGIHINTTIVIQDD